MPPKRKRGKCLRCSRLRLLEMWLAKGQAAVSIQRFRGARVCAECAKHLDAVVAEDARILAERQAGQRWERSELEPDSVRLAKMTPEQFAGPVAPNAVDAVPEVVPPKLQLEKAIAAFLIERQQFLPGSRFDIELTVPTRGFGRCVLAKIPISIDIDLPEIRPWLGENQLRPK